jgi:hypothetical protein
VDGVNNHTDARLTTTETTLGNPIADANNSLTTVKNELSAIRTAYNYTLGSVYDQNVYSQGTLYPLVMAAIAAVRGENLDDLAGVMAAIAAIQPGGDCDLQPVLDAIALIPTNPITSLQPVLDAIELIPTNPITSLQPVLDAIAALPRVPRWPANGVVTWGTAYALSDGLYVVEPVDGVVVSVDSVTPGTGRYMFQDFASYRNVGAVAFFHTPGYFETAQNFSFDGHILVSQAGIRASGYVVRLGRVSTGTIRGWRNP